MYITSLSEDGCEYYLTVSFSSTQTVMYIIKLHNFTTQKGQIWLAYFIIWLQNKPFSTKQKAFTLQCGLKRGIYSSPSEMNMRNSILQALLTRIRLINEMHTYIVIASHQYFQCFL